MIALPVFFPFLSLRPYLVFYEIIPNISIKNVKLVYNLELHWEDFLVEKIGPFGWKMRPKVTENKATRPPNPEKTEPIAFPPALHLLSGPLFCHWRGDPVAALSSADSGGAPRAEEPAHISLDCVSGRLLDKDHNMTLFLFCAGSVNRGKAPAAQRALVDVIDRKPCTSSAS